MSNQPDVMTPPYSLEAEQSVLGSLMIDNEAVDRIGVLQAKHFYREDHRAIFTEIIQCVSKGLPADVVSIWDGLQARGGAFLDGLLPYLNSIAQTTPSAANVARYAAIVLDRALLRGLIQVTGIAGEMAHQPKGKSADEVLDAVQSLVSGLVERRTRSEPRMIADILLDFVEGATKRSEGLDSAMPTGIEELDRVLNGGLRPEQLIIIAGRPSMGKTAAAAHIGLNIAENRSALMFSMEMSSLEIAGRALANRGAIPLAKVLGKIPESDSKAWSQVTHGCARLQPMSFAIDEAPALSLLNIRLKAKAWKRRHGLDLIIVDYIGLMTGGDGDKRYEQIGSYSRGLKALAKELGVAVIVLAQLNRKSEERVDRKPILSDLRDSGEIEQDADVVLMIHRPEMHDVTNTALHGFAELLVRKQRNGPLADIPMQFDGATCRFSEWVGPLPSTAPVKSSRRVGYD